MSAKKSFCKLFFFHKYILLIYGTVLVQEMYLFSCQTIVMECSKPYQMSIFLSMKRSYTFFETPPPCPSENV